MEIDTGDSRNIVYRRNGVLSFPFTPEHLVRIGDYITCTCRKDWECVYLKKVVQRMWDTTRDFSTTQFVNVTYMPEICCPVCFSGFKWTNRGSELSICDGCLRVFCTECVKKLSSAECVICRNGKLEKFNERGSTQEMSVNANQSPVPIIEIEIDKIKNSLFEVIDMSTKNKSVNNVNFNMDVEKDPVPLMLQIDDSLWLSTTNYDYEKNRKAMEENLQNNKNNGLDPYYYMKWDRSEDDDDDDDSDF